MILTIGYLYGDLMNIYGDSGNIIALKKRCEWRGIKVGVRNVSVGDKLKRGSCDIFFFGGGQDQSQSIVASDLESSDKGKMIKQEVERGIPLLSICGGYQLLGAYYQPHKGPKIGGLGIFNVYTKASYERMIGNIVVQVTADGLQLTDKKQSVDWRLKTLSYLVGFENHSGKTYLGANTKPLGKVIKGSGNNGEDGTEGCIYKNAIGCYMHGSLLPKNPDLADWLIKKALEVKYEKSVELEPLDDMLELQAHDFAVQKFS